MESSLNRENSQGTTRNRVADDDIHKHGEEVSSAEDAATAASSVRGAQEDVSGSKRLEVYSGASSTHMHAGISDIVIGAGDRSPTPPPWLMWLCVCVTKTNYLYRATVAGIGVWPSHM